MNELNKVRLVIAVVFFVLGTLIAIPGVLSRTPPAPRTPAPPPAAPATTWSSTRARSSTGAPADTASRPPT